MALKRRRYRALDGRGSVRSPTPRDRAPGEGPDRRGSAGIAGGALDGGDHHRRGRGLAAGLVKVLQVGGEARVVERPSLKPSVELAAGHSVGAAGVGRRRAVDEPDRGLDAGRLYIGVGVTGFAGWHKTRMIRRLIVPITGRLTLTLTPTQAHALVKTQNGRHQAAPNSVRLLA